MHQNWHDPALERGEGARLNLGYVNKLLASFRRATEAQHTEGLDWYNRAQNDIRTLAGEFSLPVCNVAYAVAALSNQLQWSRNIDAVRKLASGLDAQNIGMRGPVEKAKACLHGHLGALRGPKVTAFALALTGDANASVIDRWMMRVILGRDTRKIVPTIRQYGIITKALKSAAKMVNLQTTQFQAIIWLQIRST